MSEVSVVYILHSLKNDTFYVGSTNDFPRRLRQHIDGKAKYTVHILPVEVVFTQEFDTLSKARAVEKWVKQQKDRDFILRIIRDGKIKKFIP